MTKPRDWLTSWCRAMVQAQAARDPEAETQLHELGGLLRAMSEDLDREVETGRDLPFTGPDLRQHFARLLEESGVGVTLLAARTRYHAQVRDQLLPLELAR